MVSAVHPISPLAITKIILRRKVNTLKDRYEAKVLIRTTVNVVGTAICIIYSIAGAVCQDIGT